MNGVRSFTWRGVAACLALALAGAACGEWLGRSSGANPDGSAAGPSDRGGSSTAGQAGEPADRSPRAQQARARLAALAREPRAELSDEEVSALVATLDLTRDGDIALLNGVLNIRLREQLWRAAVNDEGGRLPMTVLAALASRIYLERTDFVKASMFERMGRGAGHLDWYAPESVPLRYEYMQQCASREGSLRSKLTLLPEEATSFRKNLITLSSQKEATMTDLREVIALPDRRALAPALVSMAQRTWVKMAPEKRGDLYAELHKLPGDERNTVLEGLASGFSTAAPRDADTMVGLMAEATSLATQKEIASRILQYPDHHQEAGQWLEAIDRSPNATKLQKIRQALANVAAQAGN